MYTGDAAADAEIAARVQQRFGLRLPAGTRLVRLRSRWLLDPAHYPLLTLLAQAAGSVVVAVEAMLRLLPGEWEGRGLARETVAWCGDGGG